MKESFGSTGIQDINKGDRKEEDFMEGREEMILEQKMMLIDPI